VHIRNINAILLIQKKEPMIIILFTSMI